MRMDPDSARERPDQVVLLQDLLDLAPRADILDTQLLALTILAGLVALGGLFLNSPAIIIGSMVINPLLEPIYAGTVFLANGATKKFLRHIRVLLLLVMVVVGISAVITACLTVFVTLPLTPEILSRMEYQETSAVLAIILGVIAIIARKRGFVTAIIGVGISVALIPPVVVTGIIIILAPVRFFDAFSLMANNILGLFAGMFLAVLALGVGPAGAEKLTLTRLRVYILTMIVIGLLLAIFFSIMLVKHPL